MKILITGGKTLTALKLIQAFANSEIILGDYGEVPLISSESYCFARLDLWNEEIAAHHLLTKCLDLGVDALLPLYVGEVVAVAKSLLLFEEYGISVLVPKPGVHFSTSVSDKNICVFEHGELRYTNLNEIAEILDCANNTLNGAYNFNVLTKEFALIQLPNPA